MNNAQQDDVTASLTSSPRNTEEDTSSIGEEIEEEEGSLTGGDEEESGHNDVMDEKTDAERLVIVFVKIAESSMLGFRMGRMMKVYIEQCTLLSAAR